MQTIKSETVSQGKPDDATCMRICLDNLEHVKKLILDGEITPSNMIILVRQEYPEDKAYSIQDFTFGNPTHTLEMLIDVTQERVEEELGKHGFITPDEEVEEVSSH